MLTPTPVVVDANVLVRNVDTAIKKTRAGALLGRAIKNYSVLTRIVLFAAAEAADEAIRHLPEVAERRGVHPDFARRVWNRLKSSRHALDCR